MVNQKLLDSWYTQTIKGGKKRVDNSIRLFSKKAKLDETQRALLTKLRAWKPAVVRKMPASKAAPITSKIPATVTPIAKQERPQIKSKPKPRGPTPAQIAARVKTARFAGQRVINAVKGGQVTKQKAIADYRITIAKQKIPAVISVMNGIVDRIQALTVKAQPKKPDVGQPRTQLPSKPLPVETAPEVADDLFDDWPVYDQDAPAADTSAPDVFDDGLLFDDFASDMFPDSEYIPDGQVNRPPYQSPPVSPNGPTAPSKEGEKPKGKGGFLPALLAIGAALAFGG